MKKIVPLVLAVTSCIAPRVVLCRCATTELHLDSPPSELSYVSNELQAAAGVEMQHRNDPRRNGGTHKIRPPFCNASTLDTTYSALLRGVFYAYHTTSGVPDGGGMVVFLRREKLGGYPKTYYLEDKLLIPNL